MVEICCNIFNGSGIALDYMIWRMPYFKNPDIPFFETIRSQETGAVMYFPAFNKLDKSVKEAPNYGMIDQIIHQKPVNGGYLHRWDMRFKNVTLALDELILPQRNVDIFDYPDNNDVAGILQQQGYEFVVIRKPISKDSPADVLSQAEGYSLSVSNNAVELMLGYDTLLSIGVSIL